VKNLFLLLFILYGCASVEYNVLTGKQHLTIISDEKEIKLGKSLSKTVAREFEIIKDLRIRDRINRIGYKLVEICDRKGLVYHFEAITAKKNKEKEEPNAFALPGGYIYINKKLLDMLDSDDEIAGVLAHELAHIVLRHNILKLQEAIGTQTLLAILASRAPDAQTVKRSQVALILMMVAYSKEREIEADRLGIKYMQKAGYNPQAMIAVLRKLQDYQFNSPIREYHLHSHPYLDERIEIIKRELELSKNIKK
jgi:predicted Zn-dependent protease